MSRRKAPMAAIMMVLMLFAAVYTPVGAQEPSVMPAEDSATSQPLTMAFNFNQAPLDSVLTEMSRNLGLVVIRSVPIEGRVDVMSHKPLNTNEAVDLLNTILNDKGLAGIRRDRTLTIVNRSDAKTMHLPVRLGSDPEQIPDNDQMVTQIIPVRYAGVKELVEDLQELLPSYAKMAANESSNSILLTDTQSSARRMAEIIHALDTSISEISTLRVFQLKNADAKEVADLVKSLYADQSTATTSRNNRTPFPRFGRFGPPGSENSSENNNDADNSAALKASSRVVAASDERTNSVVISAPENLMPTMEELVRSLDGSVSVLTEVRVFTLAYSDATEMKSVIDGIFGDTTATTTNNNAPRSSRFARFLAQANNNNAGNATEETDDKAKVLTVADSRTNSLVVSASHETMSQIAPVVEELDRNPAKTKRVYIYQVKNADPEEVANMLKSMFGSSTGSSSSSNRNSSSSSTRNSSSRNNNNSSSSGSSSRNNSSSRN